MDKQSREHVSGAHLPRDREMGVVGGGVGWHDRVAGPDHAITISPTVARSRRILFGNSFILDLCWIWIDSILETI